MYNRSRAGGSPAEGKRSPVIESALTSAGQ